jgi:hypothetical protein
MPENMVYTYTCTKHMCTQTHTHRVKNPDITPPSLSAHESPQTENPYYIFQLMPPLMYHHKVQWTVVLLHCVCVCVCVWGGGGGGGGPRMKHTWRNSMLPFLDILIVYCLTSPQGIPSAKSPPTPKCILTPSTSTLDVYNHYEWRGQEH